MTEIMKEKKTYYITTPIYYPSAKLHIGHTYCTVNTDALARYKRMRGYDVYFLTGADEHGQKIERKAAEAGVTPQQYVDNIVAGFHSLWQLMDISNDGFVRTTDDYHVACVQKVFKKLYDQGDIYKSSYKGMYCTPCEAFWTETQLKESGGVCPDCGGKVEEVEEESYFLNVSKYAPRLIEYIETHPEFIQPASRAKEMLNNFLLPGLEDLCVSRSTFKWGVPVSFDDRHVIYVWFDAVLNYLSKLGYLSDDDSMFKKYWPCDVHIVGKEIIRFHTIVWPIMLMALGLPLPKQVYGHGWLVLDGTKMSKSLGNCIYLAEEPEDIKKKVMSMFTDPNHLRVEDPGKVEGNPVFIYLDAFCRDEYFAEFWNDYSCLDELKAHYQRGGLGDVKVKKFLNNVMQEELRPIRERRKEWENHLPDVLDILKEGSKVAKETAAKTLEDVRHSMRIDYFTDNNLLK